MEYKTGFASKYIWCSYKLNCLLWRRKTKWEHGNC